MAVVPFPVSNLSLVLSGEQRQAGDGQHYMMSQYQRELYARDEMSPDYVLHGIVVPVIFTIIVIIGTLGNALVVHVSNIRNHTLGRKQMFSPSFYSYSDFLWMDPCGNHIMM